MEKDNSSGTVIGILYLGDTEPIISGPHSRGKKRAAKIVSLEPEQLSPVHKTIFTLSSHRLIPSTSPINSLEEAFFHEKEKGNVPPHMQLYLFIDNHYSYEEFRDICFFMDIDDDILPAEGKRYKIRELVKLCRRKGRFEELTQIIKQDNPHFELS